MKKNLIKRIMQLLEREVYDRESKNPHELPKFFHQLKPFASENSKSLSAKPLNISSKSLKSQETVISEGVCVKGELKFEKLLRINGSFEGSITSKGKITIGSKGLVKGNLTLDEAEIHGKVFGNIHVKNLIIGKEAEIHGDIETSSLSIQHGAKLSGFIKVHTQDIEDHLVFISKEETIQEEALSSAS